MAEVTIMVLKVDLGCDRCYRKVKKLLCKFPEIRDQSFFEKENAVMIKVVCCSPERIRSKLICKGGKTIKSIEIKVPEKPKPPPEKTKPPPEKPPPEKPPPEKPPQEKPPPEKPPPEKKKPPPEKPPPEKPPPEKPPPEKPPPEKPLPPVAAPVAGYPQLCPVTLWCKPCYDLGHGGPCNHGYGIPYQPPPSYDGYVRLVPSRDEPCGSWPSGCRCNRSYGCRCEYFTEENPACTIM